MSKLVKITVNRTVQFVAEYEEDDINEIYEDIKSEFEDVDKLRLLFENCNYKARFEIENTLDKVVVYESCGTIYSEQDSPKEWKGQ